MLQTAYHGTPHKFKDFSLEHTGTGEGAQAHGWGLYFAQDRKVSEDYPNNGRAVGSISPEIARTLRLDKPGAIVLDDIGLQHIEDRHGGQIRERGFDSVASFVDYVLRKFDALYEGNQNNSYELVCREQEPFKKVTVKLQFERVGEFYRISNAQFIRAGSYKK